MRLGFYLRLARLFLTAYTHDCRSFTFDLVEVFFQIVHTRLPLLNPAQFRARLQYGLQGRNPQPSSPDANGFSPGPSSSTKPLHNA